MAKAISLAALAAAQSSANSPIHLITITLDGQTLRYTDWDQTVTFPSSGGNTYSARKLQLPTVKSTTSSEVDQMEFGIDNTDLAIATIAVTEKFESRILTWQRVFADALTSASDATTIFSGEIAEHSFEGNWFTCRVLSPFNKMRAQTPRRRFQSNCPWLFGGTECGANKGELTGQTADSGGTTTTVVDAARSEADDYWRNGLITFTSGDLSGEKRVIRGSDQSSGTIYTITPFSSAPSAGDQYTIRKGCSKSSFDCKNRHDNFTNFGGFTAIPGRS